MTVLASSVMDGAAALCNDAAKTLFTYDAQLPYLVIAYGDLCDALLENGLGVVQNQSTNLTVAALATTVVSLPSDLLVPLKLWERDSGATDDDWVPMTRHISPIYRSMTTTLNDWWWQQQNINFIGATAARTIKIEYRSLLATLTGENSSIVPLNASQYLTKKTAAYAAYFIGENEERAVTLHDLAEESLRTLISTATKAQQDQPVRPRGYNWRRFLS